MDLSKLMGMFGLDAADAQQLTGDPQVQDMMQNPEMQNAVQQAMQNPALMNMMQQFSGMMTQGGMMPDDMDSIMENLGGEEGMNDVLAGVSDLLGAMGLDEIDLDEEAAAYDPAAEDAADRKFAAALKEWIKTSIAEIPEEDVCAFEIGYHTDFTDETLETPVYNLWISYNTEKTRAENREKYGEEVWNWINWTGETFRTMDDASFAAWREAQGYDEDNDGDEMVERIYDLAVVAVMELHKEKFTEQRFGRKLPFIIEDFEYYQKTAIRAVKANGGKELFDGQFFADCGFVPDGAAES